MYLGKFGKVEIAASLLVFIYVKDNILKCFEMKSYPPTIVGIKNSRLKL